MVMYMRGPLSSALSDGDKTTYWYDDTREGVRAITLGTTHRASTYVLCRDMFGTQASVNRLPRKKKKRKAVWKYRVLKILENVNDGIPPLVGNGREPDMRKRHLTTAAYPKVR